MRRRNRFVSFGLAIFFAVCLAMNSGYVLAEEKPVNVALNKPSTASTMSDAAHAPAYGNDGDTNTLWIAWGGDAGNWWQVDLGQMYAVTGSELTFESGGHQWNYQIQISLDQTNWTTVADNSTNNDTAQVQTANFTATARYIRVVFGQAPDSLWTAFLEFRVFGSAVQEVENVALGKAAIAGSMSDAAHAPPYGNDGDTNTLWIAWGGDAGNWWQIDLEQTYELIGSEITFESGGHQWNYQIQISLDQTNWTTVADNSTNNDTAQVQTANFTATARYIRVVFGQAPDSLWTAFLEFRVFGSAVQEVENVALGKAAIAGSMSDAAHAPPYGNDGDTNTLWIAWGGDAGHWWQVDLGQIYAVTGSELTFEVGGYIWNYQIQASANQTNWVTVADYRANTSTIKVQEQAFTVNARYIRILFEEAPSNMWVAFSEFKVFTDETVQFLPAPVGLSASADDQNQIMVSWQPTIDAISYNLYADGELIQNAANPYLHTGLAANSNHVYWVAANNENGTGTFSEPVMAVTPIAEEIADGKRIIVLAPHPDDEVIMAAGIIEDALSKGYPIKVLIATNGDCGATSYDVGTSRLHESINALQYLGLSADKIIALGYGDLGADDAFLSQLYQTADDTQVIASSVGSNTYGISGVLEDYHYQLTGSHGNYNKRDFLYDLIEAINSFRPTDIYTTSMYDTHGDHAYLNLFTQDAIETIIQQDNTFTTILHETVVHSTMEDAWPSLESDSQPIEAHTRPQALDGSILDWDAREIVPVPSDMLFVPRMFNRKQGALERYVSQFNDFLAAFVKSDEVFWMTDFSSSTLPS